MTDDAQSAEVAAMQRPERWWHRPSCLHWSAAAQSASVTATQAGWPSRTPRWQSPSKRQWSDCWQADSLAATQASPCRRHWPNQRQTLAWAQSASHPGPHCAPAAEQRPSIAQPTPARQSAADGQVKPAGQGSLDGGQRGSDRPASAPHAAAATKAHATARATRTLRDAHRDVTTARPGRRSGRGSRAGGRGSVRTPRPRAGRSGGPIRAGCGRPRPRPTTRPCRRAAW